MSNEKNSSKLHAIVISLPYQGHINPHINLALKLASKGITVTFVLLKSVHHMLTKCRNTNTTTTSHEETDLFHQERKSGLDIHCIMFDDGFPLEFDRVLQVDEYMESLLNDFPALFDQLIEKIINSDPSSLYFILADATYSCIPAIAKKHNLVSIGFWTEPALVCSIGFSKDIMEAHGQFPLKDDIEEEINYIPGIDTISTKDIMPYFKESGSRTMSYKFITSAYEAMKKTDFLLHNTVHELESQTLSALNRHQSNYAIGPVNFFQNLTATTTVTSNSLQSEMECTDWLNSKPPGSVLYISFGSLVQTSKQVLEEIAYGLVLSEVNFIWVVRSGIMGYDDAHSLLDGFRDEIEQGKGLIIPWCNQIKVLSHPAVGGFLTHCGWNSVLESIWCGVPMICFPVTYDQPTNRKLLVDWKIGIDLSDGTSVDRKKVAEKIKSTMYGTSSEELKQEMNRVSAIAHNAVEIDGSAENNLDQFIDNLKAKINTTTATAKDGK